MSHKPFFKNKPLWGNLMNDNCLKNKSGHPNTKQYKKLPELPKETNSFNNVENSDDHYEVPPASNRSDSNSQYYLDMSQNNQIHIKNKAWTFDESNRRAVVNDIKRVFSKNKFDSPVEKVATDNSYINMPSMPINNKVARRPPMPLPNRSGNNLFTNSLPSDSRKVTKPKLNHTGRTFEHRDEFSLKYEYSEEQSYEAEPQIRSDMQKSIQAAKSKLQSISFFNKTVQSPPQSDFSFHKSNEFLHSKVKMPPLSPEESLYESEPVLTDLQHIQNKSMLHKYKLSLNNLITSLPIDNRISQEYITPDETKEFLPAAISAPEMRCSPKVVPNKPTQSPRTSGDAHDRNINISHNATQSFARPLPNKVEVPQRKPSPGSQKMEKVIRPNKPNTPNIAPSTLAFKRDVKPPKAPIRDVSNISELPKPPPIQNLDLNDEVEDFIDNIETDTSCKEKKITVSESENSRYFKNTDRKGAKALLRNRESGSFIFRPSASFNSVLTVIHNKQFYKLGINRDEDGRYYCISAEEQKFESLDEFVNYYKSVPLALKGNNEVIKLHLKDTPDLHKN